MNTHKDNTLNLEASTLVSLGLGAIVSYLGWDKRQDKQKFKEHDEALSELKIVVARQEERHRALLEDVSEIKADTKEIKQILMRRV